LSFSVQTWVGRFLLGFPPSSVLEEILMWTSDTGFYGRDVLPSPNQQYQSTELNTKHWYQPVAWPQSFFNHNWTPHFTLASQREPLRI